MAKERKEYMDTYRVEFIFFSPTLGEDVSAKGHYMPSTKQFAIESMSVMSGKNIGEIPIPVMNEANEHITRQWEASVGTEEKMKSLGLDNLPGGEDVSNS